MAIDTSSSNGNITVTLTYTAAAQKVTDTLDNAAQYLFGRGFGDHGTEETPREYSDLSNSEKLDIIDEYVKKTIIDAARTHRVNSAVDAEREEAEAAAASEHDLG